MDLKGKVSKVAVCKNCGCNIKVCHIDYLDKASNKEFTELETEGFIIKRETIAATKKRELGFYKKCSKGLCEKK